LFAIFGKSRIMLNMFTKNQIALQTFLANGVVPKNTVSFASSIANRQNATSKQLFYVDKLVNEILEKANKPIPVIKNSFDDTKIFQLFDNAQKHLKYPKIRIQTESGKPILLAVSKNHPGVIWLSSGGFGTINYGRIIQNEGFIRFSHADTEIQKEISKTIENFAADPVKVSADHGKLTHNCCYCSKKLDTQESLDVGYGPICAKHYGLPWGKNVQRIKPNVEELVKLSSLELDPERDLLMDDGIFFRG